MKIISHRAWRCSCSIWPGRDYGICVFFITSLWHTWFISICTFSITRVLSTQCSVELTWDKVSLRGKTKQGIWLWTLAHLISALILRQAEELGNIHCYSTGLAWVSSLPTELCCNACSIHCVCYCHLLCQVVFLLGLGDTELYCLC